MPDEPRRLLICQIAFESLAGSEIVVLELVEWFTARGWTVDVSTTLFGEPIESEVAGLIAAGRLRILLPADVVAARAEQYDLIWVHHSFLPAAIIAQLEHGPISTPMIWHHLSSFQSIGLPLLYEAEDALASIITSMAPVARDRVSAFGFAQHRLELFDNPAPDAFLEVERPAPAERLESVLVVSNHPPAELAAAAELLEAGGVRVSIAGLTGQYGRVLPSSLDGR
ncbi:hypothetical protein, partial [Microcella sp.]|uniref:hypothetical protein n=1 Tax=Microcella sp. TaxID=1913979 RepID=UPI003F71D263